MRYQITGKQIDIGDALQAQVRTEIDALIEKYHSRPTTVAVVFSKDGPEFACEAVAHLSSGLSVQAKGHAHEIYAAFDETVEKMDKQLRRFKRRLKDHHKDRTAPIDAIPAASYVLASGADESEEPETLQPLIIAEMETPIPALTVGEAVMQLELANAPVLVFRNERQDMGVNVVYRREDGNIGWIDPTQAK